MSASTAPKFNLPPMKYLEPMWTFHVVYLGMWAWLLSLPVRIFKAIAPAAVVPYVVKGEETFYSIRNPLATQIDDFLYKLARFGDMVLDTIFTKRSEAINFAFSTGKSVTQGAYEFIEKRVQAIEGSKPVAKKA